MHLHKRVVATGLAVLMAVQATGCTSWKTVPLAPPVAIDRHSGRKLQVVMKSAAALSVDSARTDGTTLVTYRRARVDTIPMAEVKEVKVREGNTLKTAVLLVGVLGGAFVILMAAALGCDESSC